MSKPESKAVGHIVVVGSLNMDLVAWTQRLPATGETVPGSAFQTFPGGKGANQAVAAARLGAVVKMVGRVGEDDFGQSLLTSAANDGVDITHVHTHPTAQTGIALVTVSQEGQNTVVVVPGANGHLTPEDVSDAEAAFEGAAVLLLQLETPLATVRRAIVLARKHGARVVLNPAPAQEMEAGFLEGVDYLIPNETELAMLSGVNELSAAVLLLRDLKIPTLVVTLGEEGVLAVEGSQEFYIPGYAVRPVDTTAAGDAFVGAFAVALAEGKPTREAAEWANAAGALAVTRAGAQPSLPGRAELEAFLAGNRLA